MDYFYKKYNLNKLRNNNTGERELFLGEKLSFNSNYRKTNEIGGG